MANKAILVPPVEILRACDSLDGAILSFLRARTGITNLHRYEANVEALNLFYLVIRHVEGVLTLARTDLTLLPAANACARASFETAVKAAWMVDSDDPFQREVRWLIHLKEEERVYERAARRSSEDGPDGFVSRAAELRRFREAITVRLPEGTTPLAGNPSMEEMLRAIGGAHLYPLYIYLSQFVHGGHSATWLYRETLGTEKRIGEFVTLDHWYIPLRMCWLSLSHPGRLILSRLSGLTNGYLTSEQ